MTTKNKAIFRRYFEEVLNTGNLSLVEELIAPNYVSHYPAGYELGGGPDDVKRIIRNRADGEGLTQSVQKLTRYTNIQSGMSARP